MFTQHINIFVLIMLLAMEMRDGSSSENSSFSRFKVIIAQIIPDSCKILLEVIKL